MRVLTHPACREHHNGPGHPERPERLDAVLEALEAMEGLTFENPMAAAESDLQRAHTPELIAFLQKHVPDHGIYPIDGETLLSPGSWKAALHASGAGLSGLRVLLEEDTHESVFCAVRPPGHHAEADQAFGFCLFNNAAIAAASAQDIYGLERVAIVDFDVHHGNGTDSFARARDGLFYASTHQMPLFPGTGTPSAADRQNNIYNIPGEAGDGSEAFRSAYKEKIFPALADFRPELLILSAGFDAHANDPLAHIDLNGGDFEWVTKELRRVCKSADCSKTLSFLEGGYDLEGLKDGVRGHLEGLKAKLG